MKTIDTITPFGIVIREEISTIYTQLITCLEAYDDRFDLELIVDPFILTIRRQLMKAISLADPDRIQRLLEINSFVISHQTIKDTTFREASLPLIEQAAFSYPKLRTQIRTPIIVTSIDSLDQNDDILGIRQDLIGMGFYIQKIQLSRSHGFIVMSDISIMT